MGEPEQPRFTPQLVAASHQPVFTGTGVKILPHCTFAEMPRADIVIIPTVLIASGQQFGRDNPRVIDWYKGLLIMQAPILLSACTGTFVLAEAGLLDDRRRHYPLGFCEFAAVEYPSIRVHADRILVSATDDGRIVTSGGAASWMDLALDPWANLQAP